MTATKTKPGLNLGANMLRSRIIASLERLITRLELVNGGPSEESCGVKKALKIVRGTTARATARRGGLGRK